MTNRNYISINQYKEWKKEINKIPDIIYDLKNIIDILKNNSEKKINLNDLKEKVNLSKLEDEIFIFREYSIYPKIPSKNYIFYLKSNILKLYQYFEEKKLNNGLNENSYSISKRLENLIDNL